MSKEQKTTKKAADELAAKLKKDQGLKQVWVATAYAEGEETESNERHYVFKKPSRLQKKASLAVYEKDKDRAVETLLRAMHIGGSDLEEAIEDDEIFASLETVVAEIIAPKAANLKKV